MCTISGRFLSFDADSGPLSTVSGRLLSAIAGGCPLSAIFDRLLSFVSSDGPSSIILGGGPLSPMLPAGSWALFLTSTLSCVHHSFLPSSPLFHSFLPSLPIPLTRNPTTLTGKRLFDQVFITQRPIASTKE